MRHSTLLTEFTDISQRLEYLVAHSSQLVFVTGEDAAVQQGFVEAFLGQQSNNANVAFLSAKRGKNNQYYRQQLAEQLYLTPARKQSFVQAFASRDDKSQPVIIAITSAEYLPEDVLRELWDLVLQNRFARNGEQVNILMFGDHEWAEEVKSWLPTNNNDKPVLLTTQTLEYNEETEVEGDLDDLIANRRKLFQQRMKARAFGDAAGQSLLSTWWFKLAVASVFLISFSSILIWQYFDVTQSALKEFTQFLFQEQTVEEAASENNPSELVQQNSSDAGSQSELSPDDINKRVAQNFNEAMQRLDEFQDESPAEAEAVQNVVINSFSQQSADSPNSEYIADISAEQLKQLRDSGELSAASDSERSITTAGAAEQSATNSNSETLNDQDLLQASILDALNELDAMGVEAVSQEAVSQGAVVDNSDSLTASNTNEIALDITPPQSNAASPQQTTAAVNQIESAALSNNNDSQTEVVPENTEIVASSNNIAPTVNDFPIEQDATADANSEPLYQYHESVLLELPTDAYVLQISGISTESLLEEFLVDNRLLNSVWVYKTQRYGGDWFVVLLNQSFDSLPQARESTRILSADLQAVEPFAKSMAQIRNEILATSN